MVDWNNIFVMWQGSLNYDEIASYYCETDGIIFALTFENMPNVLIESMPSGMAIACSKKHPIPEFLKDNGFYFDRTI